jgi:predicted anti-sigma-YlaC factor YlaD
MMNPYACGDVRARLEAFYDGELPIDARVAIQQHLGDCSSCSAAAGDLSTSAPPCADLAAVVTEEHRVEEFRMSADVVERLKVEEAFSIRAQVAEWFQDMHLVWAGLAPRSPRRSASSARRACCMPRTRSARTRWRA